MKLRDDEVLVVAGIADERRPLGVARQIAAACRRRALVDEQLHPTSTAFSHSYRNGWSAGPGAVHRVEIQARGAEVDERMRFVRLPSLDIGSNVMSWSTNCAEVREARRDARLSVCGCGRFLMSRTSSSTAPTPGSGSSRPETSARTARHARRLLVLAARRHRPVAGVERRSLASGGRGIVVQHHDLSRSRSELTGRPSPAAPHATAVPRPDDVTAGERPGVRRRRRSSVVGCSTCAAQLRAGRREVLADDHRIDRPTAADGRRRSSEMCVVAEVLSPQRSGLAIRT